MIMQILKEENMSEFNFKSQPTTSIEQSERLLALGLKKETADAIIPIKLNPEKRPILVHQDFWISDDPFYQNMRENSIPAWSLGRLIEMLPGLIYPKEKLLSFSDCAYLNLGKIAVWYDYIDDEGDNRTLIRWGGNSLFSDVVNCIEWLIKEGYFNKEYLV